MKQNVRTNAKKRVFNTSHLTKLCSFFCLTAVKINLHEGNGFFILSVSTSRFIMLPYYKGRNVPNECLILQPLLLHTCVQDNTGLRNSHPAES